MNQDRDGARLNPVIPTSLIIPLFNEERRLPKAMETIRAFVAQRPMPADTLQLVLVDGGSSDSTPELLLELAPALPVDTRVLLARPGGKGAAVAKGVRLCSRELIGYCDVDFSTPLEDLHLVWEAFEAGADAVAGNRYLGEGDRARKRSWRRELPSRCFSTYVRLLGVSRVRDTQCGFKFFRAPVARAVFSSLATDGFAFDLEVLMRLERSRARVAEVPVRWVEDTDSRVNLLQDGAAMLREALLLKLFPPSSREERTWRLEPRPGSSDVWVER